MATTTDVPGSKASVFALSRLRHGLSSGSRADPQNDEPYMVRTFAMVSAVEGAHRAANLARETSAELGRPLQDLVDLGTSRASSGESSVATLRMSVWQKRPDHDAV